MTFHSVSYCLGPIPVIFPPNQLSVFDRLSVQTSKKPKSQRKRKAKVPYLVAGSVNMIGRERNSIRSRRGGQGVHAPSFGSPDSDYSPGFSQILVEAGGAFRGTRSEVAIPYDYGQSFAFTGAISPESFKSLFQWSDEEGKTNGLPHL